MRGLNCIKRLQCNLIRHLILSQSLLTRQLRSWTETALSFNAGSFYARASYAGARAQVTLVHARPCAVRPLGSLPCAHAPRHHVRCVLLAQVRARCATSLCAVRPLGSSPCAVRHVTCEPIRARHTVASYWLTLVRRARHSRTQAPCAQSAPSKRLIAHAARARACASAPHPSRGY
ncbi:hypothetical protein Hanom_Chr13g01230681 [Helianthus anomalus]